MTFILNESDLILTYMLFIMTYIKRKHLSVSNRTKYIYIYINP